MKLFHLFIVDFFQGVLSWYLFSELIQTRVTATAQNFGLPDCCPIFIKLVFVDVEIETQIVLLLYIVTHRIRVKFTILSCRRANTYRIHLKTTIFFFRSNTNKSRFTERERTQDVKDVHLFPIAVTFALCQLYLYKLCPVDFWTCLLSQ